MTLALCPAALTARAPSSLAEEPITAVFINPGYVGEVFWDLVSSSMRASAEDFSIELEILSAERDRYRMRELTASVVARAERPDFLVLVNEESFAAEMIDEADAAGIKTLFLLNGPQGKERKAIGSPRGDHANWVGELVPDNRNAGRRMAESIIAHARAAGLRGPDGRIHLFALGGDELTPAAIERQGGLIEVVEAEPEVVLDRILFANWREDRGYQLTRRFLDWAAARGGLPAAVWAANDPIALGAVRALEEAGLTPGEDVFVAGLNWSPEGLALVADGRMTTTDGGHFMGGAWAMVLIHDIARGYRRTAEAPAARVEMSAIDAANVARFTSRFPLDNLGCIDFRRFSRSDAGAYDFSLTAILSATAEDCPLS